MNFFKKKTFSIRPLFERLKNLSKKHKTNWKKVIFISILSLFIIAFLSVLIFIIYCLRDVPRIDELRDLTFAESSVIYDKTGTIKLYSIYGDENRRVVPLNEISQNFINAILAAEDDEFFSHPGLDFGGIIMGVCHESSRVVGMTNFGGLCPPRGGSTLTNQLIDNILPPDPDNRYKRKIQEWWLSWKLENRKGMTKQETKQEILELYANKISFGAMNGVETASRTFFDKASKDLTIAESSILAAVVNMPTFYSPWGNHPFVETTVTPEEIEELKLKTREDVIALPGITVIDGLRGKTFELYGGEQVYFPGRADWILERMHNLSYINDNEFENAKNELKDLKFQQIRTDIKAPHFVFYVREALEEKFGKDIIEQGGLQITTTLDWDLQEKAEEIVSEISLSNEKRFDAKNAALIASENKTGHIVAMVGSRDFWETENDGNVNIVLQKRLPGSSFKPIVYAASFLNGLSPATVLFDVKTDFGSGWTPLNYDGKFSGPVSIRKALGNSLNIPAVKAGIITGAKKVVELSNKIGITLDRDADFFGNAIALGAGEVRPIDMAQGFSVFANSGKKIPLTPILIVKDRDGNILMDNTGKIEEPEEVLDPEVAYLITDILSDPEARGLGWNTNLQLSGRKNAVKTGTSNKKIENVTWPFDTWTVGYTPQYTTVVWAGNNDGSILNHDGSGFSTAAPIWKRFMETLHKDLPAEQFSRPEGIKIIPVSRFSGKLPLPDADEKLIVKEKFASFALPKESDSALKIVDVDKISGKLPNEYTPPDCLEKRAVLNFHSYYPERSNWENPVQDWINSKGREFVAEFGVEKFIVKAPEETENIHNAENAENKPMVTISSPINFGIVTPPYIDINPQISAKNGLNTTKFYWNGELLKEVKAPQIRTSINIPTNLEKGSNHEIQVVAIDELCYSGSSTISVKIGSDDSPPNLSIIFPEDNAKLNIDSVYTFLVNAFDEKSSVDKLDFFVDGNKIGSSKERPFSVSYKTETNDSNHKLTVKAYDTAGNFSELSHSFETENISIKPSKFGIISPKNNSQVKAGETINISVGITEEMASDFNSLTIYIQTTSGKKIVLSEFNKNQLPTSRIFNAAYSQFDKDNEVYARIKFGENTFFSERIKILSD